MINNSKEYWELIYTHWNDLFVMFNIYLPTFQNKWIDGSILNISLGDYLLELKENKNPKLVRALNSVMWNCPEENSGEWAHKVWPILYSLCVEEDCLFEEREII